MAKKADRQDDSNECIRATADDEIKLNMDVVDKATEKVRPKNTNDQYRPKILEFKAFCRFKYAGEGETILTLEKVHNFLFYQAHRQKRKRMKDEEILIDHDGSKAEKSTFLYHIYACSLNVLCGTILVFIFKERTLYLFSRSTPFFIFKEHTMFLVSWNAPCVYFQGTYLYTVFKEHFKEQTSNGFVPLSSYETANNDPHGEEYTEPSLIFCVDEYQNININHDYKNHIMRGWSSFRAYLNALTYLLDHQKDRGHNYLPYGCLRKNGEIKKLIDLVKTRHVLLAKINFDESLKNASMRFQIVAKIPDIEEGFWKRNGIKKNFHCASLRDRYFYLFTITGIVRGESPIQAELSDMFSIVTWMKDHLVMMQLFLSCKFLKVEKNGSFFGVVRCVIKM
jgi:hypothetical protein